MTSNGSLPPWSYMQLLAWIAHTRTAASRAGTLARRYALTLECYTRTTPAHAGVLHSRDAVPLTLEFYTRAMPFAGVQTMAASRSQVMYSICREAVLLHRRQRPRLLSSDMVYQP